MAKHYSKPPPIKGVGKLMQQVKKSFAKTGPKSDFVAASIGEKPQTSWVTSEYPKEALPEATIQSMNSFIDQSLNSDKIAKALGFGALYGQAQVIHDSMAPLTDEGTPPGGKHLDYHSPFKALMSSLGGDEWEMFDPYEFRKGKQIDLIVPAHMPLDAMAVINLQACTKWDEFTKMWQTDTGLHPGVETTVVTLLHLNCPQHHEPLFERRWGWASILRAINCGMFHVSTLPGDNAKVLTVGGTGAISKYRVDTVNVAMADAGLPTKPAQAGGFKSLLKAATEPAGPWLGACSVHVEEDDVGLFVRFMCGTALYGMMAIGEATTCIDKPPFFGRGAWLRDDGTYKMSVMMLPSQLAKRMHETFKKHEAWITAELAYPEPTWEQCARIVATLDNGTVVQLLEPLDQARYASIHDQFSDNAMLTGMAYSEAQGLLLRLRKAQGVPDFTEDHDG